MRKRTNKNDFIQKPEYPGGGKALGEFINKNIQYPVEALKNKIAGKVLVEIEVDFTGKVVNNKVLNGIGYGCDEEALRVTKLLKYSSPKNRGLRVQVKRKIGVNFNIKQEKTTETKLNYVLKEKKEESESKKPESGTLNYTIQW